MCGFVGYLNHKKKNKNIIKEMSNKIIHRGPDSEGYFADKFINMAFRRLSIIDLKTGDQPLYNEDKSLVIMFNGEIYNYQTLKDELVALGHVFQTNTDTEVILHGYEEYQEHILDKLRGMYAFVIYNKNTQEVFIARDIFGIKPMYYALMNDTFFFGSEIKAFLPHPDFKKELNKDILKTYLIFQYNPNVETFFKGVYKLEPGHYIKYKNKKLENKEYFKMDFKPQKGKIKDKVLELQNIINESVNYHLVSDVPVFSFLSGGVDSSYITSLIRPDKTFTVGFNYKGFDETTYAKDLCEILKLQNISENISKEEFMENVKNVQYYSDEPHANLSSVPLFSLTKLASKHGKVVLSGEGADELFGGYIEYYESPLQQLYEKLPLKLRKFNKKIANKMPKSHLRNLLIVGGTPISEYYIGQSFVFNEVDAQNILTKEYQNDITPQDITKPYFDKVRHLDNISQKQYLDMHVWLPNDILLKADKMSMANSIELRVPYLDKEVLDFAFKIPKNLKYHNKESKYLLRAAAKENIPEEWFNRKKIGFLVPFKEFLKDKDVYETVKNEFMSDYAKQFFKQDKIMELLNDHFEGKALNQRKIYNIYTFLIWYKMYFIENN